VTARAGILAAVEIRPAKNADGRDGSLLQLGDVVRLIIAHERDGAASVAVVDAGGRVLHEWYFPPSVMDAISEWAAGPTRLEGDEPDALQYCSACFNGRCGDCKGADVCQCDHAGRNALAEDGPGRG